MAHILIVDDEPSIRDILARCITRLGHHTLVVSDGLAALAALDAVPFDLVVTDLSLPGLDGASLIQVILARSHRPRIILCTGIEVSPGHPAAAADLVLYKPFAIGDVTSAVSEVLATRGAGGSSAGSAPPGTSEAP